MRQKTVHKCEFCGEYMQGRFHAHEECLKKHLKEMLEDHKPVDNKWRLRLRSIGYDMKDFKEEMGLK